MRLFIILILTLMSLSADEADWRDEQSWGNAISEEEMNTAFEKAKIENRANRVYDDKIYRYITGDYTVQNNQIELGAIILDDQLYNEDIEINLYTEDLQVEGNSYKDGLDIRRNQYRNYVAHDNRYVESVEDEPFADELDNETYGSDSDEEELLSMTPVYLEEPGYSRVEEEDITEIGKIDLRGRRDIKEVNVLVEDVDILVD
ncbi:MAG: hypothetical protein IE889_09110 [Campylobacterales bacterium]|nr:hypothetical protein [Campylobacterales bacterium]